MQTEDRRAKPFSQPYVLLSLHHQQILLRELGSIDHHQAVLVLIRGMLFHYRASSTGIDARSAALVGQIPIL